MVIEEGIEAEKRLEGIETLPRTSYFRVRVEAWQE